jgi:hypothetical protein
MIEKIQAYEVPGKGTATQAKVEVQSRYTTQDKAIIYYDLRDPNQTMDVYVISTGGTITLPYRILSYQKITVTGEDRTSAVSDIKLASNIVFRERPDVVKKSSSTAITVGISFSDGKEACMNLIKGKTKVVYIDNEDFSLATLLTEDEGMKERVKDTAYIASDSTIRYWKGEGFDQEFLEVCER